MLGKCCYDMAQNGRVNTIMLTLRVLSTISGQCLIGGRLMGECMLASSSTYGSVLFLNSLYYLYLIFSSKEKKFKEMFDNILHKTSQNFLVCILSNVEHCIVGPSS